MEKEDNNNENEFDETKVMALGESIPVKKFEFEEGSTQTLLIRDEKPPSSLKASLILLKGPRSGTELIIDKSRIMLGRDSTADVCVRSPGVSRKHAMIIYKAGDFLLHDFQSRNGTFLNGSRISDRDVKIQHGDRITLGDADFQFLLEKVERPVEFDLGDFTPAKEKTPAREITEEEILKEPPVERKTPLRRQLKRLKTVTDTIVDAVPTPIIVVNRKMKIITANDAFKKTYGIEGLKMGETNIEDHLPWLAEKCKEALAKIDSEPEKPVEIKGMKIPDIQGIRIINLKMISLQLEEGLPDEKNFLVIIDDVTEKKN